MGDNTKSQQKRAPVPEQVLFKRILHELKINPNDDEIKFACLIILSKLDKLTLKKQQKIEFYSLFTTHFIIRLLNTPEYESLATDMLEQVKQLTPDELKPYEKLIVKKIPDFFFPTIQKLESKPVELLNHLAENSAANERPELSLTGLRTLENLFREKNSNRAIFKKIFKVATIYLDLFSFETLCALSTRASLELRFWIELGVHEKSKSDLLEYNDLLNAITILDKMCSKLEEIELDETYAISDENLETALSVSKFMNESCLVVVQEFAEIDTRNFTEEKIDELGGSAVKKFTGLMRQPFLKFIARFYSLGMHVDFAVSKQASFDRHVFGMVKNAEGSGVNFEWFLPLACDLQENHDSKFTVELGEFLMKKAGGTECSELASYLESLMIEKIN